MLLPVNQAPEIKLSFEDDSAQKQRRQMFIALTLLLAALILILTKDRDFWFPSAPVFQSASEPLEETSPEPRAQPEGGNHPYAASKSRRAESEAAQGPSRRAASSGRRSARHRKPSHAPSARSRGSGWGRAPPSPGRQQFGRGRSTPTFHPNPGVFRTTDLGCGWCGRCLRASPSFSERHAKPFTPG